MAKSFMLRVKILEIGEVEEVSNNFKKREVIGVIEGEYPEYYKFEFVQDKVSVPDELIEGVYANIHFNLKGRKVEKQGADTSYFLSAQAWKVEAANANNS